MNPSSDGITVQVSGPADSGKTVVASVIFEALAEKGFTSISLTDQQGALQDPYETKTVLEMLQLTRPELFDTPVAIVEVTEPSDDLAASVIDDDLPEVPDDLDPLPSEAE